MRWGSLILSVAARVHPVLTPTEDSLNAFCAIPASSPASLGKRTALSVMLRALPIRVQEEALHHVHAFPIFSIFLMAVVVFLVLMA